MDRFSSAYEVVSKHKGRKGKRKQQINTKHIDDFLESANAIIHSLNSQLISSILSFINTDQNSATFSPYHEIPTALVFSGINMGDYHSIFNNLVATVTETHNVAILESTACSDIKNLIKSLLYQVIFKKNAEEIEFNHESDDDDDNENQREEIIPEPAVPAPFWQMEKLNSKKTVDYDIEILSHWYNSQSNENKKMVVVIKDLELFDSNVLSLFISACSACQNTVPFVFVISVATSMSTVRQMLTKNSISLLSFKRFEVSQSHQCLEAIIEKLFIQKDCGLKLGSSVYQLLFDNFQLFNLSIQSFLNGVHYIMMDHYYANPLCELTDLFGSDCKKDDQDEDEAMEDEDEKIDRIRNVLDNLDEEQCENIRECTSFKRYVESIVPKRASSSDSESESTEEETEIELINNHTPQNHVAKLFFSDEYLKQQVYTWLNDIQTYNVHFHGAFLCLLEMRSLLHVAAIGRLSNRNLYKTFLNGLLLGSDDMKISMKCFKKWELSKYKLFMEKCLTILLSTEKFQKYFSEEIKSIQSLLIDIVDEISDDDQESAGADHKKGNKRLKRGWFDDSSMMEMDEAEREIKQITRHKRTTKVSGRTGGVIDDLEEARRLENINEKRGMDDIDERIYAFFDGFFKDKLRWYKTLPLNEIIYYNNEQRLKKALNTQPRQALITSFKHPKKYVDCKCCDDGDEDSIQPTLHDTTILYRLHNESGKLINIFDWYVAFGAILERGNGDVSTKEVQARFARGVSEMHHLGFIQLTNRKLDHVTRLTWW